MDVHARTQTVDVGQGSGLSTRVSPHRKVAQSGGYTYFYVGLAIFLLFTLQYVLDLRWEWLAQMQQREFYKQTTGYLLLIYILYQWELGIHRKSNSGRAIKSLLGRHRYQGAFGPLLFYFHSIELGYAYQMVLSSAFIVNCLLGLLNKDIMRLGYGPAIKVWLVAHIALAVLVSMLVPYHMYIVYRY